MNDQGEPPPRQDGQRPRHLLPGLTIVLIGIIGIGLIILMCIAVALVAYLRSQ